MSEPIVFSVDTQIAENLEGFTFPDGEKDGLKWTWKVTSGFSVDNTTGRLVDYVFLLWKFDWEDSHGFEGKIKANWYNPHSQLANTEFSVQLSRSGEWIQKRITTVANAVGYKKFGFSFELDPVEKTEEGAILESIFVESDFTDVVLIVEEKKIHVNKTLLSCHSDYFRALFSSDFQEKSMKEIAIEDVKFEYFAAMLSLIINPIPPTADNIVPIMKLSDRFLMRYVPKIVDLLLWKMEDVKLETVLMLASIYKMKQTQKWCLSMLKSNDHIKKLGQRDEFKQMTPETKAELLSLCLSML